MELSVSTPYQIKIENRDRLFYEKYQYCFSFRQEALVAVKQFPNDSRLSQFVDYRAPWANYSSAQTSQLKEQLRGIRDLLLNSTKEFKLVISYHHGLFYTSDLTLANELMALPGVTPGQWVKQAKITRERDVIEIRAPKFKYRAYFKESQITQDQKNKLLNWVQSQGNHIHPSSALKKWLSGNIAQWKSDWIQRYYYIEYNDAHYETMMAMVIPNYIRKTYPVTSKY